MARSKKSALNGHEAKDRTPSPESERPAGPLSIAVVSEERDPVKVNNYNSTELKNACDDALRRVSCQSTPIHACAPLPCYHLAALHLLCLLF